MIDHLPDYHTHALSFAPSKDGNRSPGHFRGWTLAFLLLWLLVGPAAPLTGQVTSQPALGVQPVVGIANPAATRHTTLRPTLDMAPPVLEVYGQLKKVVQWASPSVVHIEARKYSQSESRLFADHKEENRGVEIDEAGAGVIFAHQGAYYVLTNRHVVDGASPKNVFVQLPDGTFYYPYKIWDDSKTDLAVLGLKGTQLPEAQFGDSNQVTVGDFVVAIGSPFGLNHSVSYGIISATGRRNLDLGKSGVMYQDFFQTDAAINPGNSGGPLINLKGEVIAVNTAIASNSGGNDGIGFAIPIRMALKVATDLIDHGEVRRSFLGVTLDSQYDAQIASSLGLNTVFGARVLRVGTSTPASAAGLQVGDVILEFQGKQVKSDSHLVLEVSQSPAKTPIPMTIYRDGRKIALSVSLVGNVEN